VSNFTVSKSGITNLTLCSNISNFYINSTIRFYADDSDPRWYYTENFFIMGGVLNTFNLYLLPKSDSEYVTFNVKNGYQQKQENIIVKVLRYYPNLDDYLIVAMGKTGYDGTTSMPLKYYEYYKIFLQQQGNVINTYTAKMITESSIDLYTDIGEDIFLLEYYNDVASSCYYNSESKIILCQYTDSSGCLTNADMNVYKLSTFNNSILICQDSSASPSGVLTCNISDYSNNTLIYYYVEGTFQCSPESLLTIASGTLDFHPIMFNWGLLGLLISVIIIAILAPMAFFDPRITIIFSFLGMVIAWGLNMIPVGFGSIVALGVGTAVIIYNLRERR